MLATIVIWYHTCATSPPLSPNDEDFFAMLEHRDRICEINDQPRHDTCRICQVVELAEAGTVSGSGTALT